MKYGKDHEAETVKADLRAKGAKKKRRPPSKKRREMMAKFMERNG